jgi:hypothetical protein
LFGQAARDAPAQRVERGRRRVRQREPDLVVGHSERVQQAEVLADHVPAFRVVRIRVERTGALLAQVPDREADDARRARGARQDRRLHQPLQIDRDVVGGLAQRAERGGPPRQAGAFERHGAIDRRHQIDDGAVLRVHQPVDAGGRKRPAQRRRGGHGVDDVPERPEADDEDIHLRMRARRSRVE